jgi:hypothetical protein
MHNLFLVYFVNLYKFRAYLGPSSGGTTVCMQQLVLIILFRWISVVLSGVFQSNQDNRRNLLRISCASSWFFLHELFTLFWKQEKAQNNNLYVTHPFVCYCSYPARGKQIIWLVKIKILLTKITRSFAFNKFKNVLKHFVHTVFILKMLPAR